MSSRKPKNVTSDFGLHRRLRDNLRTTRPGEPVFKRFRIAILLYVLLFVALGQFLASRRATDWNDTLWVDVHIVDASGAASARSYIDRLEPDAFAGIEQFFAREASRHGVLLERPFGIRIAGRLDANLPSVPNDGGMLAAILFSLRMRWFVTRLNWSIDGAAPDITLFAIYHDADSGVALDRSTALRKGMIAVANLFASPAAGGSNQVVIAHELLHTLGASDKYDLATGLPLYPIGFADPDRMPLYPQSQAELMAGRIPIDARDARTPPSFDKVVIGPATALEIGWRAPD
jgi:hypothetical protein